MMVKVNISWCEGLLAWFVFFFNMAIGLGGIIHDGTTRDGYMHHERVIHGIVTLIMTGLSVSMFAIYGYCI